MPFGFIIVQYMNNLRDHVVTIFNVLFYIRMTWIKQLEKTFFLYLDTLDLIDVNPFVFDPNFFLNIKYKKEIHSR